MSSWVPTFALPNVDVDEPIEVDGMALVSLRDYRIHELANKHKNFAEYRLPKQHQASLSGGSPCVRLRRRMDCRIKSGNDEAVGISLRWTDASRARRRALRGEVVRRGPAIIKALSLDRSRISVARCAASGKRA
jgi:hypothetical protein